MRKEVKILLDGIDTILPDKEELEKRLEIAEKKNKPLRIKFGIDPTSSDLHLGHTVVMNKLREFQDLGHHILLLIGDFTALIGDPSGRSKKRIPISKEQIEENMKTYENQIYKILDPKKKFKIFYNSHWYDNFYIGNLLELTSYCTLAQILEREDFKNRYKKKEPISLSEILYPLVQAYDSVYLKADIELGGTDQTFNLLLGREIQKYYKQEPQLVITLPILEGIDGKEKMSKSMNNAIYLEDTPKDIFGKLMSIPDELTLKYLNVLKVFDFEIRKIYEKDFLDGKIHPKKLKEILAEKIVERYHGGDIAQSILENFNLVFSKGDIPKDISEFEMKDPSLWNLLDLICSISDFSISSKSEGRRLIRSGSVYINQERVEDEKFSSFHNLDIIQVGKKRYKKIKIKE